MLPDDARLMARDPVEPGQQARDAAIAVAAEQAHGVQGGRLCDAVRRSQGGPGAVRAVTAASGPLTPARSPLLYLFRKQRAAVSPAAAGARAAGAHTPVNLPPPTSAVSMFADDDGFI
jgi:hypothetical protein